MGRGGGGGSSHSSSHSSSSHSHSGSSRSSGSSYRSSGSSGSSYRSSGSSYRSSGSSYSRHSSGSGNSRYSGSSGSGSGGGGCFGDGCSVMMIPGIIFVLAILTGIYQGLGLETAYTVERSTIQREALPASKCEAIDEWYQDDWGDWIDETGEERSVIEGLEHFYEKTGVQPYLWIMGEEGGDYQSEESVEELADVKYAELFGDDEGHLLVIFREYPDSSGNYIVTATPGYDAETQVMDDQAKEILLDYIDYYYEDDDLNEGLFFYKAFTQASDRIMTKQLSLESLAAIVVIVLVLVIGLIITISIIRKRKAAVKKQKAKQAQAEKDKKIIEQNQKKYQEALAQTYVTVICPNCGSRDTSIRKGTVGYCNYCGTAMKADENGTVVIVTGSDT